jgi:hypothetical protein
MRPLLGISQIDEIPVEFIDDFESEIGAAEIDFRRDKHGNLFAGIEWLLPTAVVVFVAKSYFDSMLSELGKDHYKILKRSMAKLYDRLDSLNFKRIGTAGKVSGNERYSAVFSVVADSGEHASIKLLLQPHLSVPEVEQAIDAFFDTTKGICSGTISPHDIEGLDKVRVVGRTILLAYDFDKRAIVAVDPLNRSDAKS